MTKTYETVMLSKLIPYANNPRKNDDAVPAVEASIEQVGYITPIVVDENYEVLAGHTRLKALNAMGTKEAEVLIVDGLTDEEKRKYRILDNKTGDFAEWDVDLLEVELADLDFGDFDFGFDFNVDDETEIHEANYQEKISVVIEVVAEYYKQQGFDFTIVTSAKNMIHALNISDKWILTRWNVNRCSSSKSAIDNRRPSMRTNCRTAGYRYV